MRAEVAMRFNQGEYFKAVRIWFFLNSVQRLGVCRQKYDMVGATLIKVDYDL
jgi:hypothetical protein